MPGPNCCHCDSSQGKANKTTRGLPATRPAASRATAHRRGPLPAPAAILSRSGAQPGQVVKLKAGLRIYVTVVDGKGHYAFRAKSIPGGAASLTIGNLQPTTVNITTGVHIGPGHGVPQGPLPVESS